MKKLTIEQFNQVLAIFVFGYILIGLSKLLDSRQLILIFGMVICSAIAGHQYAVSQVLKAERKKEKQYIDSLVDAFLAWKLPTTCRPDPYPPESPHAKHNSGTNLLTAEEARQMFEYLLSKVER